MPIGPRISNAVRYVTTTEALRDRKKPRSVVVAHLQDIIGNQLKEPVPRTDTLLKMVSHARKNAPDPSDAPWSMAHLNQPDCEIAPATVSTVLQTWRYAVATHEPFSVPQATWASRLHGVFPEPALTWWWSLRYSFAETASALSNLEFDTSMIDATMVMGPFEYETADLTGFCQGRRFPKGFNRDFALASDGSPLYELIHLPEFAASNLIPDMEEHAPRHAQLHRLIYDLAPLDTLNLDLEAKYLYLRWLTHLYTGPNWANLGPPEIRDLIVTLRQSVISHLSDRADALACQRQLHFREWPFIYPLELLLQVGFSYDDPRDLYLGHPSDEPDCQILPCESQDDE